tara:strand:+ start:342 stop:731 length:390 start_codon:yes stop_codon:yes gene_type:complete
MGDLVDLNKFREAKLNGTLADEIDGLPPKTTITVHEFSMDMDGLEKLAKAEKMDVDRLINLLPDEIVTQIFTEVKEEFKHDDKVSDVHDACFEVQLLAEQYPEHAGFIEKQVHFLVRQLILYIHNKKEK